MFDCVLCIRYCSCHNDVTLQHFDKRSKHITDSFMAEQNIDPVFIGHGFVYVFVNSCMCLRVRNPYETVL